MPASRKPSSRNPEALPTPARLRDLLRGLAMLDAILEPEWEDRTCSFDPAWAPGEALGSMRNGEGDWFFAWFPTPETCAIRGFAHESPLSPFANPNGAPSPGLYEGLPPCFAEVPSLGGFPPEEVTFCLWHSGERWQAGAIPFPPDGEDPDGSGQLLSLLDGDPSSYVRFARDYHEKVVPIPAVRALLRGDPLTPGLVRRLHPEADLQAVATAAREIGYPFVQEEATPEEEPPVRTATAAASPPTPGVGPGEERRPPAPRAAVTPGAASFTVEVRGPTVRMLVGGKPTAEYTGDVRDLYVEIFKLVKDRIKRAPAR